MIVLAAGGVRSLTSALTLMESSRVFESERGNTVRFVPNSIALMVVVSPFAMGKFCSPPLEKLASAPFELMTVDCFRTLAQPALAAMSSEGSGWLTMEAWADVVALARK